jgi:hypothetical protein
MTAPPAVALELHCAGYARMSLTPAGHDALAAVRACARTLLGQHDRHDLAVLAGTAAGPGVPYAALPPLPPVLSAAAVPVLAAYERHAAAAARAVLAQVASYLPGCALTGGTLAGTLEVSAYRRPEPAPVPRTGHAEPFALQLTAVTRSDISLDIAGMTVTVPGTWPWEVLILPGPQLSQASGGAISVPRARIRARGLPGPAIAVTFTATAAACRPGTRPARGQG